MQLSVSPFQTHEGSPGQGLDSINASPEGPDHPQSYMDILNMLQEVSHTCLKQAHTCLHMHAASILCQMGP